MFAMILVASSIGLTQSDEVERLLSRNEAMVSGIRTLRATIRVKQSVDGGQSWRPLQTIKVVRSGSKELVRTEGEGVVFRGKWQPATSEQVDLYEPSGHQTLSVQPPGSAGLNHAPASGPLGWVNPWKAQAMLSSVNSSYRGVAEKSTVRGVTHDGDKTTVSLEPKEREFIHAYRWTFSASHAGLVTRTELDWRDPDRPGPNQRRTSTSEVLDFWNLGPGLLLPKVVRSTSADDPKTISLVEINEVVCNEPVGDEEFKLPIPSGTVVVDHRENKYHLWGKDTPAQTFQSSDEFNTWRTEQNLASRKGRSSLSYIGLGIAVACVILIAGLIVHRRRVGRFV